MAACRLILTISRPRLPTTLKIPKRKPWIALNKKSTSSHYIVLNKTQPLEISQPNMITTCYFDNREIQLSKNIPGNFSNKYSIIVGKNGTGKSRLLSAIVSTLIKTPANDQLLRFERLQKLPSPISITSTCEISKIVAVSTSPFDRFPVVRRSNEIDNYRYLGLRGIFNSNLGLAFMGRIIGDLVKSILLNPKQAAVVGSVLEYLGYKPRLTARAVMEMPSVILNKILTTNNPLIALTEFSQSLVPLRSLNLASILNTQENPHAEETAIKIVSALKKFIELGESRRTTIEIDRRGILDSKKGIQMSTDYSVLFETGIIRLRDVTLQKIAADEEFRISDASSGEQSVVLTLLGIASHIQDNALICIDEPEICLHPEWQEKYMGMLISTFSHFKNCHFIVATHSPQIIANLTTDDCFVVDIEKRSIVDAAQLAGRSVDFQLATVFNSPGYKNEYLSRSIVSLLTKIGTSGDCDDQSTTEAEQILSLREKLQPGDPVSKLMQLLSDALKEAKNK